MAVRSHKRFNFTKPRTDLGWPPFFSYLGELPGMNKRSLRSAESFAIGPPKVIGSPFGMCAKFDRSLNTRVDCGVNVGNGIGNGRSFTAMAFCKLTIPASGVDGHICGDFDSVGSNGWKLDASNAVGHVGLRLVVGNGSAIGGDTTAAGGAGVFGRWANLAVTFSITTGKFRLYVDGIDTAGAVLGAGYNAASPNRFSIGDTGNTGEGVTGLIQWVAVWPRVVPAGVIKKFAIGSKSPVCDMEPYATGGGSTTASVSSTSATSSLALALSQASASVTSLTSSIANATLHGNSGVLAQGRYRGI